MLTLLLNKFTVMIRTILTPKTQTVFFDIPKDYVGKELEVIAFAKSEGLENTTIKEKKFLSFDTIKIDTTHFKFNRDEANER